MRPAIDRSSWASNLNFSIGPLTGQPTKIRPSVGLYADGYQAGTSSAQPSDRELNYTINQPGLLRQYLDGLEGYNFRRIEMGGALASSAFVPGSGCTGMVYDASHRAHYTIGHNWNGTTQPSVAVFTSISEGDNWGRLSVLAAGAGHVSFPTGPVVGNGNGDWLALGAGGPNTAWISNCFIAHDSSVGPGSASLNEFAYGGSDVHARAEWCGPMGAWLVVGKHSGNTAAYKVTVLGTITQLTLTAPQSGGDFAIVAACGDTYCLIADALGYMWRAPADPTTGFVAVSAFPSRAGIVGLVWLPIEKLFLAMCFSTGSPFPTGMSFWTSVDGSVWTLRSVDPGTGIAGAAFQNGVPDQPAQYVSAGVTYYPTVLSVQGSTVHCLLQSLSLTGGPGSTPYVIRAMSLDSGTTWQKMPLPIATTVEDAGSTTHFAVSLYTGPGEDRMWCTATSFLTTGAGAMWRVCSGLRLGD